MPRHLFACVDCGSRYIRYGELLIRLVGQLFSLPDVFLDDVLLLSFRNFAAQLYARARCDYARAVLTLPPWVSSGSSANSANNAR